MIKQRKKLSFCITCKNRLHQISKTLKKNLDDNRGDITDLEFILVDFNSSDNLKDFVKDNFTADINEGYLHYYECDSLIDWHSSIAKNISHSLGSGEIIVNLDCDNFTGENGGAFILEQFRLYGEKIILHQASGQLKDGSYGRISVMKKYFETIGGYDESLLPMAYQDVDLIQRLVHLGLSYVIKTDQKYNLAIANTKEEGLKYVASKIPYMQMNSLNIKASKNNIALGKIIANKQV